MNLALTSICTHAPATSPARIPARIPATPAATPAAIHTSPRSLYVVVQAVASHAPNTPARNPATKSANRQARQYPLLIPIPQFKPLHHDSQTSRQEFRQEPAKLWQPFRQNAGNISGNHSGNDSVHQPPYPRRAPVRGGGLCGGRSRPQARFQPPASPPATIRQRSGKNSATIPATTYPPSPLASHESKTSFRRVRNEKIRR